MGRIIRERGVRLVITTFVVSVLAAFMLELLPGDPITSLVAADYNLQAGLGGEEAIQQLRASLGLDDPVHVRYGKWLGNAVQGDLGTSLRTKRPVTELLLERLPVTIELMVIAQLMAIGFALLVAPISALKKEGWFDRVATTGTFGMISLPHFILGLLLLFLFAVELHWLPAGGFVPIERGLWANIRSLLMPATALATAEAAIYTRLLRAEMVNTLDEDFITLANAKGLPSWRILVRHGLRPSSLPLVTLIGLNVGRLIGGSVIVEVLFSLPGIGRLAVDSIFGRDYIAVQGIVVFVTLGYVVVNFGVDLLYYVLDPRIRHARLA